MTSTAAAAPDEPQDRNNPAPKWRKSRSRKRANGEGTIYQRKDGRYEGAAFVPTTTGTTRACPVDHGTGSRSQIRIEATSTVPRQTKSRLSYLVATARCWRSRPKARSTTLRCL